MLLEREISVKLSDLAVALENVATRCSDEELQELFISLAENTRQDKAFSRVIEEGFLKFSLNWGEELINSIISAGQGLGYQDVESNTGMLTLIIKELEEYIVVESRQMQDKLKVYRTISVAAGISLSIILI